MELPTLKFDVYHGDKKTGRIEIENGNLIKKERGLPLSFFSAEL